MTGEYTGSVKWYKADKGFGFITAEGRTPYEGEDSEETEERNRYVGQAIFVHFSSISDNNPPLVEGEKVEFDIVASPKGPSTKNVRRLS